MEANDCYYEKVSEELEKIVHEVKDGPADGNAALQPTGQKGVKSECYFKTKLWKCKKLINNFYIIQTLIMLKILGVVLAYYDFFRLGFL